MSLLNAVEKGDVESVKSILMQTDALDINALNSLNESLLIIAAKQGYKDIVQLLLAHGADPNFVTSNAKMNALHFACQSGHHEIVEILISLKEEKGGAMDINSKTGYGWTPAHFAAALGQYKCLEILFKHGANPDLKDPHERTPLSFSAKLGHAEATRILLKAGANPNIADELRQTPLHKAASVGALDCLKLMVENTENPADLNLRDKDGHTAFDLADIFNHSLSAMYLWLKGTQFSATKGVGLAALQWSRPWMKNCPSPRYGAAVCVLDTKIFLMGGYGVPTYKRNVFVSRQHLNDLYMLDTATVEYGHVIRLHERCKTVKKLSSTRKSKLLALDEDELTVSYLPTEAHFPVGSIQAEGPFLPEEGVSCAYFEVTIVNAGLKGSIGIGLADESYGETLDCHPGWDPESFGYHGDDGQVYHNHWEGTAWGPLYTTGDVIGCGINFLTEEVFFTKNGEFLGIAFRGLDSRSKYYATVGFHSPGEKVTLNFGQKPFRFNFEVPIYKWIRLKTPTTVALRNPRLFVIDENQIALLSASIFDEMIYVLNLSKKMWETVQLSGTPPLQSNAVLHRIGNKIYICCPSCIRILNLETKTWEQLVGLTPSPPAQTRFRTCALGSKIYLWQGENPIETLENLNDTKSQEGTTFHDIWCFDTLKNEWSEVRMESKTAPNIRYYSTHVYDNKIICFGGWDGVTHRNEVWIAEPVSSDGKTLCWYKPHVTGTIPRPRNNHSAAVIGKKIFYFFGWNGHAFMHDIDLLDLETNVTTPQTASLSFCFNNPRLHDVIFTIDNQQLFANKVVLCSRSSYFRKLFDHPNNINNMATSDPKNSLNETIVSSTTDTISITDVTYDVFFTLVKFLYEDRLDISLLTNKNNYLELVEATQKYAPELTQRLSEQLILTRMNTVSTLLTDTSGYCLNPQFADIVFEIGGKEVKAHKAIICSRNDFFRGLCISGLQESYQNLIRLKDDLSYEHFVLLLKSLYGVPIDYEKVSSEMNILDVLSMACKYQGDHLKRELEDAVGSNLNQENVLSILLFADTQQCERLKKYCLDLIATDLDAILNRLEYQQQKVLFDKILGSWIEKERQKKIHQKEELFYAEEKETVPSLDFLNRI